MRSIAFYKLNANCQPHSHRYKKTSLLGLFKIRVLEES